MLFSVIIPTCNRNDLLGKCLDRLHYDVQGLSRNDYEVIVTDDSKENLAREFIMVNFPWVQWVEGPKRGPAANRNNGAKQAKGEWLVFLDDDCEPDSKILEKYRDEIQRNVAINVFEGKILPEGTSNSPIEYAPVNTDGGHLWSCNFSIFKTLFISIEGFDENFRYPHMEDIDLRERLLAKGEIILFAKDALVTHPWRKLTDGKKLGKYQEMYVYFHVKHHRPFSLGKMIRGITMVHLSLLKRNLFTKEAFIGVKLLLEHVITVLFNFKKWKKKYAGKS